MIDSLDLKIIQILMKDARTPFSNIAKGLGVSPSIVQIRFNRLRASGIVLKATLVLDPEKFGIVHLASMGVKVLEPNVEEVMKFMSTLITEESRILTWPTLGRYNINALIMSRDLLATHRIKQSMKEHSAVLEVGISVNVSWYVHAQSDYESLGLEKELGRR